MFMISLITSHSLGPQVWRRMHANAINEKHTGRSHREISDS